MSGLGCIGRPRLVADRSSSVVSKLRLDLTDPDARCMEDESGVWYLVSRQRVAESNLVELRSGGDGASFCQRYRGALVIRIDAADAFATRVRAWRGLFANAELYYSSGASGEIVLSDHFRNVLVRLPRAHRYPSDDGLAEHFLFRRPYGTLSYSAHIRRLGTAESIEIDLNSGETSSAVFDRIGAGQTVRSDAEYVELVGSMLEAGFAQIGPDPCTLGFSGGVDSTLLLSYVADRVEPYTFVTDTPEFLEETTYARNAAQLLGVVLNEVPMREDEFLGMLESTTEIQGTPSFDDATPYLARLILEQPNTQLLLGLGADSAFGMSLKMARFSSWFRHPVLSKPLSAVSRNMPGHLGYRMRQVAPIAASFGRPLLDPYGYAGAIRTSGNTELLQEALGSDLIESAHRRVLEHARPRVELSVDPSDVFWSHLELAHWLVVFNNFLATNSAIANASGKRVLSPYGDPDVLSALATIPVRDRYVRGLSAKWILKKLLTQRLPQYPVKQRKKATALPWQRFYIDGPLTGVWNRYSVPELFDGDLRNGIMEEPTANTWTAISYSIWVERVVRNDGLDPHPARIEARYEVAAPG